MFQDPRLGREYGEREPAVSETVTEGDPAPSAAEETMLDIRKVLRLDDEFDPGADPWDIAEEVASVRKGIGSVGVGGAIDTTESPQVNYYQQLPMVNPYMP